MVMSGFSLGEVRKLHVDEFFAYYEALIYIKEQTGEVKPGTSSELAGTTAEDDINSLKSQMKAFKR
jgi:hypothetical protein